MTNKETIQHSLLPQAEGLLIGMIWGMEQEFDREGAVKILTRVIEIIREVQEKLNEDQPQMLVEQLANQILKS